MSRGHILTLLLLALIPSFAVTGYLAGAHHERDRRLAEKWYERGETHLREGRAGAAVDAFSNALRFSRDDPRDRLRLAQALIADGRDAEASSHLLTLREDEPGNGTINLELGRLAARSGDLPNAVRYYHRAIDGAWEEEPERWRRVARFELAEFLVAQQTYAAAQAELIALAANVPDDSASLTRVGRLFLHAKADDDALRMFRRTLEHDPRHPAALAGAGEASFRLANYRAARNYLSQATRLGPTASPLREMLQTSTLILAIDPFQPRLAAREQGRRAAEAFGHAVDRLAACARELKFLPGVLDEDLSRLQTEVDQLTPRAGARSLARDPDLLEQTMDLVFRIENTARQRCGQPQGHDLALLLIGQRRTGAER